ncbi:hypothetical protein EJP617_07550 [Erwinia sp. Ejp617]|nr:hypothetical protein [Erwinia sp. Ejp617]ADP10436.1 hypothetical protein EJP617_07550 [Erwinia sp. Ejp617]
MQKNITGATPSLSTSQFNTYGTSDAEEYHKFFETMEKVNFDGKWFDARSEPDAEEKGFDASSEPDAKEKGFDARNEPDAKEKWFDARSELPEETLAGEYADSQVPITEDLLRCVKQLICMLGGAKQNELFSQLLAKIFPAVPFGIITAVNSLCTAYS